MVLGCLNICCGSMLQKKNSSLLDIPNNFSFMSEIKFILLSNVRMPYLKLMQSIKIGILKMRDEIIHF